MEEGKRHSLKEMAYRREHMRECVSVKMTVTRNGERGCGTLHFYASIDHLERSWLNGRLSKNNNLIGNDILNGTSNSDGICGINDSAILLIKQ